MSDTQSSYPTATLLSLAPEIHYEIAFLLDSTSRKSMRLTCRQIALSVEALLFTSLVIPRIGPISEQTFVSSELLALWTKYCRKLVLRDMSQIGVYSVVSALVNVTSLELQLRPTDTVKFYSMISTYIEKQKINTLILDLRAGHGAMDALTIRGLQSLTIRGILPPNVGPDTAQAVTSQMIANSPGLHSLDISTRSYAATSQAHTLHDFLPTDEPRLEIEHLRLSNMRTLLNNAILPHLRSLKSLAIHFNLPTPELGCLLGTIWDTLQRNEIYLQQVELNLTDADDTFFKYITSYRGLKGVILDNSYRLYHDPEHADKQATRFFEEILPVLAPTLEVLVIKLLNLNKWCVWESNYQALFQCKNLRVLVLSTTAFGKPSEERKMTMFREIKKELPLLTYFEEFNDPDAAGT